MAIMAQTVNILTKSDDNGHGKQDCTATKINNTSTSLAHACGLVGANMEDSSSKAFSTHFVSETRMKLPMPQYFIADSRRKSVPTTLLEVK